MTYLTIKDCAKLKKVTIHAIRSAVRSNKLKAEKNGRRWLIKIKDLFDYEQNKFNRDLSIYDGKLRFDFNEGELSLRKCCKIYNLNEQQIYYAVRKNKIPAKKKGGTWVLNVGDIERYKEEYCTKKRKKKKLCRIIDGQ